MPFLTKQYKFCAAHRYWNDNWSDEENKNIFGKDIYIHGHNYLLDVTISGPINVDSGFIMNLKTLNDLIHNKIINIFDHSQIDKDISWFHNRQPSTEHMVVFIWSEIVDGIPSPAKLHKLRLQETPTIYTEYFGPQNGR